MKKEHENWKEIREGWYKRAKEMKPEGLAAFISELTEFSHDYNTICYAIAAAGVAAMHAVNRGPNGGITSFQAGAIMWEVIWEWNAMACDKGTPMRLITYDNLLYPQYEHVFRSITPDIAKWAKEKAQETLQKNHMHPNVEAHMKRVADGEIPFGLEVSHR